jgi:hypothetical protein
MSDTKRYPCPNCFAGPQEDCELCFGAGQITMVGGKRVQPGEQKADKPPVTAKPALEKLSDCAKCWGYGNVAFTLESGYVGKACVMCGAIGDPNMLRANKIT